MNKSIIKLFLLGGIDYNLNHFLYGQLYGLQQKPI